MPRPQGPGARTAGTRSPNADASVPSQRDASSPPSYEEAPTDIEETPSRAAHAEASAKQLAVRHVDAPRTWSPRPPG